MSHYEDEAQVAELKKWWKENRLPLAAGLILGLGGIAGWEGWKTHNTRQAEQASQMFEDLKRATQSGDSRRAQELTKSLQTDYARTPYATHAALLAAQRAAAAQDWDAARTFLTWAQKNTADDGLQLLARLREARVLSQQGKLDEALKRIPAQLDDSPFVSLFEELRGDIKRTQGDTDAARAAYEKALAGAENAQRELLQRKLDDLAPAVS